jgi:hypothetical protein
MREIRPSGSEGGVGRKPYPYPYQPSLAQRPPVIPAVGVQASA